jgi:hypothetical protein
MKKAGGIVSRSRQEISNTQSQGSMRQETDADDAAQAIRDSTAQEVEQIVASRLGGVDLDALAAQLATLRSAMRQEPDDPDRDIVIGDVAQAEKAARQRDPARVAEHLRAAGKWAADIAEKIGVGVAVVAIKAAVGL